MVITPQHLAFLEEAKRAFKNNQRYETYRNKDNEFIALRDGMDRDCIDIFELGANVGCFVQSIPRSCKLVVEEPNYPGGDSDER